MADEIVPEIKKESFNVLVLTDDIEKQELTNKITEYISSYYPEVKENNSSILFTAMYKFVLNVKNKRIKIFNPASVNYIDAVVEVDGFGFESASLREKCYNYITENNLVIVKIK